MRQRLLTATLMLLLAGCASYDGRGLLAGQSGEDEVLRIMGSPAWQGRDPDGSRLLAYPRGPMGVHTFMVRLGADGKLIRIENVLAPEFFARIEAGMSKEQVLKTLGPPQPAWTVYFAARDELAWEWRYCDDWNQLARFNVLFDASREVVRSTLSLREDQTGHCGRYGSCSCAR